jgi:hypothetical protein
VCESEFATYYNYCYYILARFCFEEGNDKSSKYNWDEKEYDRKFDK